MVSGVAGLGDTALVGSESSAFDFEKDLANMLAVAESLSERFPARETETPVSAFSSANLPLVVGGVGLVSKSLDGVFVMELGPMFIF